MAHSFVHLHMHTDFSLLDGANQLDPLFQQIKTFEQPAVAITDHGNLFGAIQFYTKAKAAGINPIIGCEVYMAPGSRLQKDRTLAHNDYYHLILLAQNATGYHNLIKLVSQSYLDGFYYKPRIDKALLQTHHEGLIALSGCLTGEIPYLLGQGDERGARQAAMEFVDLFGPERFYLEVQANGLPQQYVANQGLLRLHRELGIPLVGTNDCHYLRQTDAHAHDLMLCLQTGKTVQDADRFRFETDQLYVKTSDEMHAAFADFPNAAQNTVRIAEACALNLTLNKTYLPQYPIPDGLTREQYLEQLALDGLRARLHERPSTLPTATYELRLRTELTTISTMGFAGYFLIVWDIIRFARSRHIPVGPGRGSAAGSLVAYALRITDLDPLQYTLLFERFLNPERVSLPDIDMDFCMTRRNEVINYVIEKYGSAHVAQIITFGTLGAKAALRDVGRVLNLPYMEVDRLAKLVPPQLNITLDEALAQEPKLKALSESTPQMQEVFDVAHALEGMTRHASTHAAGIVISDAPLTEHVPLYKGPEDEIVTQYAMGDVEKVGLVKFDFLGLKTLTMIQHAVDLINQRPSTGIPFTIEDISFTDPDTFRLLGTGKTTGLFQLESSGMRDLLTGLKPDLFEDIIAIIALYRPGPMDLIPDFILRKQGKVPITYETPELEPILKDTYGVIVYQEQVMAIAHTVAGFSLGQADILRRAMGKKKPEEMEKLRRKFIDGCVTNQVSAELAEKLFSLIERFAGYGFNKSHAAAYAVLCYQTAYLKAHYPVEFMAALLTTDMGVTDKIMAYFTECRDLSISILPPDINHSTLSFSVVDGKIRFGLGAIKNVGEQAVESIVSTREESGPFTHLFDFCSRVDLRKVNRRSVEGFIKVGAFDSTQGTRAQLMACVDDAIEHGTQQHLQRERGQITLFTDETTESSQSPVLLRLPAVPEWTASVRLKYERELTGFYISAHPLDHVSAEITQLSTTTIRQLDTLPEGQAVTLCGILTSLKPIITKKGQPMAVVTLEDLTGTIEIVIFPDLYQAGQDLLVQDQLFRLSGELDQTEKGPKLKATKLELFQDALLQTRKYVTIDLHLPTLASTTLQELHTILTAHPGPCAVTLQLRINDDLEAETSVLPGLAIAPTEQCVHAVSTLLGPGRMHFSLNPPARLSDVTLSPAPR